MVDDSNGLRQESLRRVLAVARQLGASADLKQILSVIIDAMREVLNAERATVFEFDPEANELFSTVAHGIAEDADEETEGPIEIRFSASTGLAGESVRTRAIINIPDAHADDRFNPEIDRKTGFRTRSLLTIPLIGHDSELIGVAQVLNRRGGPFTANDEEIASALASQAAVALKRGRLIEDRIMRQKLESDLELARTIQQSGFPKELPTIDGYDLAAWSEPAEQTGGDTYDVVALDDCDGSPGRVFFLLGDATGHGVGPALAATQVRSMLRMAICLGADLMHIASQINRQLCQDLPEGQFVTAWFGELDVAAKSLTSFSTGQGPLLHHVASQHRTLELGSDVLPMGIVEDIPTMPAKRFTLGANDVFAVISDGIFEQTNHEGEEFGTQRVSNILADSPLLSADETVVAIQDALDEFRRGIPINDDRTIILIKRLED